MSYEAKPPEEANNTPLKLRGNSLLDWTVWAITDIADNVVALNKSLDKGDDKAAWNDVRNLLSLRRWAFILPGGGKLRGGRRVKVRLKNPVPPPPKPVETKETIPPS